MEELGILMLAVVTLVTAADPTIHQAVVCLVNDSPAALQDELYLHCSRSGSINIRSALHGFREQAADTRTCGPPALPLPSPTENPGCQTADPLFLRSVRARCMGSSECYLPVARVYLDGCKQSSNYVHVEYECVSDNSVEPDNIVDICGEMLQGTRVSRPVGYIRTPDYPDLYPPDISCSCNLTALGKQAQVMLTLLDIQLEAPAEAGCQWDWLEFTVPPHGWGHGVRMCHTPPGAATKTFTANKTVVLNFRADNKIENRGFWLKYEGQLASGGLAEVLLKCKNFQPNIVRKASACLSEGETVGELYMDCEKDGVINVLSAQYGRRPEGGATSPCLYQVAPPCVTHATSDQGVLRTCMGQGTCTLPVTPQPLPPCAGGADSDYLQVKYQCIPEAYEPTNIVDVCGDILSGKAAFRHSGYIQSPRYPLSYPPNLACQCLLSTDSEASIRLGVLDVRLSSDTISAACDADWLAYTTSHAAQWGAGSALCHAQRGHAVDTHAYEVRVDFFSDDSVEDRGFWLQYSAVRPDGLHVGVQIMCKTRSENTLFATDTGEGATPLSPGVNTGLVIGLALIALLIFGVVFMLAILKYKRIRKGKLAETAETPVVREKGGVTSTFKRYTSLGENYHTLHNTRPDASRTPTEPQPDYDVTTTTSHGTPGSYVNPAFDGTLEPASYHNVAC